jgi:hypothetical protein
MNDPSCYYIGNTVFMHFFMFVGSVTFWFLDSKSMMPLECKVCFTDLELNLKTCFWWFCFRHKPLHFTAPHFKSDQMWLKNYHLASLLQTRDTLCAKSCTQTSPNCWSMLLFVKICLYCFFFKQLTKPRYVRRPWEWRRTQCSWSLSSRFGLKYVSLSDAAGHPSALEISAYPFSTWLYY